MKHRRPKSNCNRAENLISGLISLTGSTSTDWALWNLFLLLREIAETNEGKEDGQPPAPSFEEAE
jgi:hypothetical protein